MIVSFLVLLVLFDKTELLTTPPKNELDIILRCFKITPIILLAVLCTPIVWTLELQEQWRELKEK